MEVFDDLKKEHQKEVAALMKRLARMEERALRAERERDECKDKIPQQRHKGSMKWRQPWKKRKGRTPG